MRRGRPVRTLWSGRRLQAGPHRFTWDLRHDGASVFEGMVLEAPSPETGPWAVPGAYRVRLSVDGEARQAELRVEKDPRLASVSQADLEAQLELALAIRDATSLANETVMALREAQSALTTRIEAEERATAQGTQALLEDLHAVERELYQTKNRSPKDKIAYPIRLNDRLAGLLAAVGRGDAAPTTAHYEVFDVLKDELDEIVAKAELLLQSNMLTSVAANENEMEGIGSGK